LDVKDINKFPFLTKPQKEFVDKALRHLLLIGALDSNTKNIIKAKLAENELNKLGKSDESEIKFNDDTYITEVGKLMIKFPVIPRLARILILSNKVKFNLLLKYFFYLYFLC
jgi:HrpA-like RNA helicase